MTIPQSQIAETRVHSPADRVLDGVSTLPLQPSGSCGIDVAALHMHHVTVEGIRFSGDDKTCILWLDKYTRGIRQRGKHSSVQGILPP